MAGVTKLGRPITPSEAAAAAPDVPGWVLDVFNELIASRIRGGDGRAVFTARHAAAKIAEAGGITKSEVYERGYLDVERLFRAAGWDVHYDQQSYEATFTFEVRP